MKKIIFQTSEAGSNFEINIPGVGKNGLLQRILEVVTYLRIKIFSIFIVLTPISIFFFTAIANFGLESSLFVTAMIFCIFMVILYAIELTIAGSKKLIDPPGMLNMLLFALLATTSAVLIPLKSSENTFGNVSEIAVKGLSGISVILFLIIFYFTILNTKSSKSIVNKFNLINISGILFTLFFALILGYDYGIGFIPTFTQYSLLVFANVIFIVISFFSLLFIKAFTTKFLAFISLISNTLLIITLQPSAAFFFIITFASGITLSIINIIQFIRNRQEVNNNFKIIKLKLFQISKSIKKNSEIDLVQILSLKKYALKLLVLYSGVILLSLSLILVFTNLEAKSFFESGIRTIADTFNNLFRNSSTIFTGSGASSFDGNESLIAGVIQSNGLLGLFAYLLVFFSIIFNTLTTVANKKIFQNESYKLSFFVNFLLLFGSIVFVFIYPGMIFLILWWTFFALSFALQFFEIQEKLPSDYAYEISEFKLGGKALSKYSKPVKMILTLSFVIFGAVLILIILSMLGRII